MVLNKPFVTVRIGDAQKMLQKKIAARIAKIIQMLNTQNSTEMKAAS